MCFTSATLPSVALALPLTTETLPVIPCAARTSESLIASPTLISMESLLCIVLVGGPVDDRVTDERL